MSSSVSHNFPDRVAMSSLRLVAASIGFVVPLSVVLDNVLLALVLPGLLFNARAVGQIATQNPVARAAWLLFGVLSLAMTYGAASLGEALAILGKYIDLAFIPLLMLMLSDEIARRRAQYAFLAAMALTLFLSYLLALGLLPVQYWMSEFARPENPVVFHSHITQNNMMAFAAFLALLKLRDAGSRRARLGWGTFAVLAAVNVFFMVQGRTGYIILIALLGWLLWVIPQRYMHSRARTWGWWKAVAVELVFLVFVATIYSTSPRLHNRLDLVVSESQALHSEQAPDTSTGQRLLYYDNTLQIVRQHPLFGVGTGGFAAAFAEQVQGKNVPATHNPHNEYLMIAVQTGVLGLALLLYLFYTQWRCALSLNTAFERDAARGLVLAYMVNCAFNSALLDHSDGLFFAFMISVLFAGLKLGKNSG